MTSRGGGGDAVNHRQSRDDTEAQSIVSTEHSAAAVIDSLKYQLQQSALAQQTSNIQLAAIKQVLAYLPCTVSLCHYVLAGFHSVVRY